MPLLISGKLLYNVALCYLASGNLWLSSWVKWGNPSHRRQRWKVCYISQKQQEQPCLLLRSHLHSTFYIHDKRFSQDTHTHNAPRECFCNVSACKMLPHGHSVFQAVTNEILIEIINNMASGWKMMRWRTEGGGGEGGFTGLTNWRKRYRGKQSWR